MNTYIIIPPRKLNPRQPHTPSATINTTYMYIEIKPEGKIKPLLSRSKLQFLFWSHFSSLLYSSHLSFFLFLLVV